MNQKLTIFLTFVFLLLSLNFSLGGLEKATANKEKPAQVITVFTKDANSLAPITTYYDIFDNGNSFVRIEDDVSGKDIVVQTPKNLNADQFIELLIKLRTLKTNGANAIYVSVLDAGYGGIDGITVSGIDKRDLPVLQFLTVAGADFEMRPTLTNSVVSIDRYARPATERSWDKIKRKTNAPLIVTRTHDKLASELSDKFQLKKVTIEEALLQENSAGQDIILLSSPSLTADVSINTQILQSLVDANKLRENGFRVQYMTPYLPYARSDKADQPGVTTTGALMADLIEAIGVRAASFVRAHAPQSQGFFRIPSANVSGKETITAYLRQLGVEQIVSPDAGFQKDATAYAKVLGLPVSVVNKARDLKTGKDTTIVGISGDSVSGKIVAIIDDETASGGTLGSTAEFLKSQGAVAVYGVVTHLAGTGLKALENPALDQLIVTDTLPVSVSHPKLTVLSIASELGAAAVRLSTYRPGACQLTIDGNKTGEPK